MGKPRSHFENPSRSSARRGLRTWPPSRKNTRRPPADRRPPSPWVQFTASFWCKPRCTDFATLRSVANTRSPVSPTYLGAGEKAGSASSDLQRDPLGNQHGHLLFLGDPPKKLVFCWVALLKTNKKGVHPKRDTAKWKPDKIETNILGCAKVATKFRAPCGLVTWKPRGTPVKGDNHPQVGMRPPFARTHPPQLFYPKAGGEGEA